MEDIITSQEEEYEIVEFIKWVEHNGKNARVYRTDSVLQMLVTEESDTHIVSHEWIPYNETEEIAMYFFLLDLTYMGNFATSGEAPNKQNPSLYRQSVGENPKNGYAYGATCGSYELSASGKWLVDGEEKSRPV